MQVEELQNSGIGRMKEWCRWYNQIRSNCVLLLLLLNYNYQYYALYMRIIGTACMCCILSSYITHSSSTAPSIVLIQQPIPVRVIFHHKLHTTCDYLYCSEWQTSLFQNKNNHFIHNSHAVFNISWYLRNDWNPE